jgi:hypothetical protein
MKTQQPIHEQIDHDWDLRYMAKHQTTYFDQDSKSVCQKFLQDNIVTPELLKIYTTYELENWGDISNKPVTFTYNNWTIKGIYHKNKHEYPVEILSITQNQNES